MVFTRECVYIWKLKPFVAFLTPVPMQIMKKQTFENAAPKGKIWKCNALVPSYERTVRTIVSCLKHMYWNEI